MHDRQTLSHGVTYPAFKFFLKKIFFSLLPISLFLPVLFPHLMCTAMDLSLCLSASFLLASFLLACFLPSFCPCLCCSLPASLPRLALHRISEIQPRPARILAATFQGPMHRHTDCLAFLPCGPAGERQIQLCWGYGSLCSARPGLVCWRVGCAELYLS